MERLQRGGPYDALARKKKRLDPVLVTAVRLRQRALPGSVALRDLNQMKVPAVSRPQQACVCPCSLCSIGTISVVLRTECVLSLSFSRNVWRVSNSTILQLCRTSATCFVVLRGCCGIPRDCVTQDSMPSHFALRLTGHTVFVLASVGARIFARHGFPSMLQAFVCLPIGVAWFEQRRAVTRVLRTRSSLKFIFAERGWSSRTRPA